MALFTTDKVNLGNNITRIKPFKWYSECIQLSICHRVWLHISSRFWCFNFVTLSLFKHKTKEKRMVFYEIVITVSAGFCNGYIETEWRGTSPAHPDMFDVIFLKSYIKYTFQMQLFYWKVKWTRYVKIGVNWKVTISFINAIIETVLVNVNIKYSVLVFLK